MFIALKGQVEKQGGRNERCLCTGFHGGAERGAADSGITGLRYRQVVCGENQRQGHQPSVKEQLDTSTNSGKLILQLIGAINEFERRNILERQREGIECAKQRGVYKGRKPKELDVEVFEMVRLKKISVAEAGRKCGCSRATIYNHLKNS